MIAQDHKKYEKNVCEFVCIHRRIVLLKILFNYFKLRNSWWKGSIKIVWRAISVQEQRALVNRTAAANILH